MGSCSDHICIIGTMNDQIVFICVSFQKSDHSSCQECICDHAAHTLLQTLYASLFTHSQTLSASLFTLYAAVERTVLINHIHLFTHHKYRLRPGRRNTQIETANWIWGSFFKCALETRWQAAVS